MLRFLLKILFPQRCIGCNKNDHLICSDCLKDINRIIIKHEGFYYLDDIYTCCESSKLLRKIVHFFKYRYKEELHLLLGSVMTDAIRQLNLKGYTLTYIPLHYSKLFDRGFNQAKLLSDYISSNFEMDSIALIKRIKKTNCQAKLCKADRFINVSNAFQVRRKQDIRGRKIIIIDDIATTGATLESAAKVLKEAGASEVIGLAICKGI